MFGELFGSFFVAHWLTMSVVLVLGVTGCVLGVVREIGFSAYHSGRVLVKPPDDDVPLAGVCYSLASLLTCFTLVKYFFEIFDRTSFELCICGLCVCVVLSLISAFVLFLLALPMRSTLFNTEVWSWHVFEVFIFLNLIGGGVLLVGLIFRGLWLLV
jgi:hypothetical protein